jgi:hypothetical protein
VLLVGEVVDAFVVCYKKRNFRRYGADELKL